MPEPAAPLWEEIFRAASPEQQRELLSLAGRQGLLYAHQLPPSGNGAAHAPTAEKGRPLLARLLAGQAADLTPLRTTPVVPFDDALDEAQREAVARALQTPDVCLIQGLPGSGKSRVVAEVVTQAAARGERVLLVAPHAGAVDRVLEAVADRDAVCPFRCLASGERPEFLSAAARSATLVERSRRLTEHTLPQARAAASLLEKRCLGHAGEEGVWPRLEGLAREHLPLAEKAAALERARAAVPEEVAALAARLATDPSAEQSDLATHLRAAAEARSQSEKAVADLAAQLEARRKEKETAAAELEALKPLADAKEHKRVLSLDFWKAAFKGDLAAKKAELEARLRKLEEQLPLLEQQLQQLRHRQEEEARQADAERAKLQQAEVVRRQARVDEDLARLRAEKDAWRSRWDAAVGELLPETPRPAEPVASAVADARAAWEKLRKDDEERLTFARQWAAGLEQVAESFPARLVGLANLVAATTAALPTDPNFGDAATPPVVFDLLILEGAESVGEADLTALARRARRWVLVGQTSSAASDEEATPAARDAEPSRSHHFRGRPPVRRPAARPAPFPKLWRLLHTDPRDLPSAWVQEETGLCCRLRPVTAEQSQYLETEHLADRPDVELRIVAAPRAEPVLAEIVFPPSVSIAEAKEYVFRELEQLPVASPGRGVSWQEHPDRLVLRLADEEVHDGVPVALAPGLRERVFARTDEAGRRNTWATCCVEFDRAAGWQREQAEEWAHRHLGLRDLGRTARLDAAHRMRPELAAVVSDWLFAGAYRRPQPQSNGPAAVEFVAVPGQREGGRPAERAGARAAAVRSGTSTLSRPQTAPQKRGGAGLELDLSDPRSRERLPADLLTGLPESGFANLPEAQAVVRAVEALVVDPALRAAARRDGGVGVVALYAGQAELIRRLLQQTPAVAGSGVEVSVDVPAGFRDRECPVVLVSLTRSHTHRAVSYGDGPQSLLLALTRARSRLLLFGDPGTLARRAQWESSLDHLDEAASASERAVVTGLLDYLHGRGPHPQAFALREGGGA